MNFSLCSKNHLIIKKNWLGTDPAHLFFLDRIDRIYRINHYNRILSILLILSKSSSGTYMNLPEPSGHAGGHESLTWAGAGDLSNTNYNIYNILARIIKHSCTCIKVGREGNKHCVWDPFP